MAGIVYTISSLLIAVTGIVLSFILLRFGSKKVHYIWAIYNLIVIVWGVGSFLVGLAKNAAAAMVYWKIALVGAIVVPIVFYHVIVVLAGLKRKISLTIFYAYSVFFCFLTLFNFAGIKITYIFNSLYYIRAVDHRWGVLVGIWVGIIFYSIFELYKLFKKSSGSQKIQYQYLFIGFAIGFTGALLDTLPFFGINVYPVGNFLICIYILVVTYAIFRHNLLDIEVIVKKTLVFTGLFAVVYAVIAGFAFLSQVAFENITGGNRLISLIPSIALIVFILRPLDNFLIRITDKFLFQKEYDYRDLLKTFTTEVLTVRDLDSLVKLTAAKIADIIKVQSVGVLLLDEIKDEYKLMASYGIDARGTILSRNNTLTSFLDRTKTYLSTKQERSGTPLPERVVDDMNQLNLELAIPLIHHEDMIGILTLGKKKSDENYTQDDMDILLSLAGTLAIAIKNARVLEELGKKHAEDAQHEKMAVIGTLSAGINHEICNPLGIARGQCEAFLLNIKDGLYKNKSEKELVAKAQNIMEKVIHETDRATAITKRLSSFAKPSKGVLTDDIDIRESVDEVLGLVGYEMKLDKINVVNEIPGDFPHVTGDKKQIQEVFFNLIRNAAQAIRGEGAIFIKGRCEGRKAYVEIEDNGQGIAEDKLSQIFNPFYTTKVPGEGTGLGLFIVRSVVERNKGRISVRSREGVGTTFVLEFPVAVKVGV